MQKLKRKIRAGLRQILILLLSGLFFSASLADELQVPVTDDLLRALGLDREYHTCTSVADGDTVFLEGSGTVRFIGVDTSEKNHPQLPVQFMSKEAGAFMKKICLGKKVRIEYDPYDSDKRGNYGRALGYAYLEDGTFLQEELIKNGYAIAYTRYPFDESRKAQFLAWEQTARNRKIGLWEDDGLPEVCWILMQRQPLLQITNISEDQWRIEFGNRVLKPVHSGDLENHLGRLYASIFEFGPRDLRARLKRMRYKEKPGGGGKGLKYIYVIGMAHKKWGIIYNNYALARVLPQQLDEELMRLSGRIDHYSPQMLPKILLQNRYRLISEIPVNAAQQQKIAGPFLTIDEISGTGDDLIPWDLAGDHIGRHMVVEGKIVRTHNSGKACFLNFHNNWTRYFSLVIFDNVFHRFPEKPEEFYRDKRVRASGKIKLFRGRPEMVLNSPKQIKIIDNP